MVFATIHRPLFAESKQVHFPNKNPLSANKNGAFCKVRNTCKGKVQSWTKLMENLNPLPPYQRWKNGTFLPFARLRPWFGGEGKGGGGWGLGMGVILSKIVALLLFKLVKRNARWYSRTPNRFFVLFFCFFVVAFFFSWLHLTVKCLK